MRNQYEGVCFVCNTIVEPGQGHFTNRPSNIGKKWSLQHWWHASKVVHTRKAKLAEAEHKKKYEK